MTHSAFVRYVAERLSSLYPFEEGRAAGLRLLDDVGGIDSKGYAMLCDSELDPQLFARLDECVSQMCEGKPLQYVTGFEWFHGHRFDVEPGVLIPRPESEELVEWAAQWVESSGREEPVILDAACGSGALGVALALMKKGTTVLSCDISPKALEVTSKNACKLGVDKNGSSVTTFECDILNSSSGKRYLTGERFDAVISNPPYVCESEKIFMRPNVVMYEPFEAIFVPDADPLLFYRSITDISAYVLKAGGALFFEINEMFGADVVKLMKNRGFADVEIRVDFRGKERMVKGYKK